MIERSFWLVLGLVALGLAILGAVLPLLPTTPFLLAAAYAFARSSPRLETWLLTHPQFGPLIVNWQRHGSIPRPAKRIAVVIMAATLALTWFAGFPLWVFAVQVLVLSAVATFILTRPS